MNDGKLSIVVIDDGINAELYNIGILQLNLEINENLNIIKRENDHCNFLSHGTTCAAIIKKYVKEAPVGSIKILNDQSHKGAKYQLIKTLQWCATNGVKLVNMSLGTIDFRDFDEIRECVNDVAVKGVVIVAACNNNNVYTMPACLTNVIGVRCNKNYIDDQYSFIPYTFDGIEFEASGRHYLTDKFEKSRYTGASNSYAAPLITARVYQILETNPNISIENIKKELSKGTLELHSQYNPYICINSDWIGRYTKMDSSDFEKDSFNMEKITAFDTVVINPDSNENMRSAKPEQIIQCLKSYHKNIIYLHKSTHLEHELLLGHEGTKIWSNCFYKNYLKEYLNFEGENVDVPVIMVFDSQNNVVLSYLHSMFGDDGYYSVKVSTNNNDILTGCEYLPEGTDVGKFLSKVYKKYNCDVILMRIDDNQLLEEAKKTTTFDVSLYISYRNITKRNIRVTVVNDCWDIILIVEANNVMGRVGSVYKKIIELFN